MDPLVDCEAYCENKLAHPDSDYPLLRVFLDEDSRRLHAALQTLRLELLSIPDEVTQTVLIPVAYYTGTDFKPAKRIPSTQITHWNDWGARR